MSRMETTDIVIHKGEKEKKYQLYVEDYVMSFLKNYGSANGRKIFFYGTREQKNKIYYIYGAGHQKNISYFVRYELLDEIVCRFDLDKPVFSIKEDSGRYELSGYYIFYQSNEAMQSYMIEQRKGQETEEKAQDKFRIQGGTESQNKLRPQDFSDIRTRSGMKSSDEEKGDNREKKLSHKQTHVHDKKKEAEKSKGRIMAFQLSAVFLVLAAIIINSTNSYSKLRELGQSAVEVFFTMENQEASKRDDGKSSGESEVLGELGVSETPGASETAGESEVSGASGTPDVADGTQGTVLRLEDLDAEFEKENQEAKEDADNMSEQEAASGKDKEEKDADSESTQGKENAAGESTQDNNSADPKEEPPSQEAFARNFAEYYQIEKGDTLCKISIKLYGDVSKVNEICEINKIDDPDNIKYGQKILLP